MIADFNSSETPSNLSEQNETKPVDLDPKPSALVPSQIAHAPSNEPIVTNQFLNKLSHSVGHDLRSPIFVIRSYTQLLQRNSDKDRLDRGLDMIGDATVKMEKIIDGLIQLVDIYTVAVPEYDNLEFQKVFDEVKLHLYNEIDQFKPKLVVDFNNSSTINFPVVYLKEIMVNLIDNAMRHNADNKDLIIKVNTIVEDGKTILNIIDNGSKIISTKEVAQMKDPFFSDTEDQSCAGTGLSKVEAIAQKTNSKFVIEKPIDFEMMVCKFVFA